MAKTILDLLNGHSSAVIHCLFTKKVVRELAVVENLVEMKAASGEYVSIRAEAVLHYEPWTMDRGSLYVATTDDRTVKLCTEFDVIGFEDGTLQSVERPA